MQDSLVICRAFRDWDAAKKRFDSKFCILMSAYLHFNKVSFEMQRVVSPNREPDQSFELGFHGEVLERNNMHHANGVIQF